MFHVSFLCLSLLRWCCPWQGPEPLAWCLPLFLLQARPKKITPPWWRMRYFLCAVFWVVNGMMLKGFTTALYFSAFTLWHTWVPDEVRRARGRSCWAGCSITEEDSGALCFVVSGMLLYWQCVVMKWFKKKAWALEI